MDSMPYADIIILALIAGFILLRLRSVLGEKKGNDNPQFFTRNEKDSESPQEKVIHISDKVGKARPADETDVYLYTLDDEDIAKVIADVKKIDPAFSATGFLEGAKMAFEMVFDAFNKGDKKQLEMLLEKSLYESFAVEIDARKDKDTVTEATLVSVKPRDIVKASLTGNIARFTVEFDSEQVTLTRDKEGKVVKGDASHTEIMDDEWVFERDISSKNPNWKIIET